MTIKQNNKLPPFHPFFQRSWKAEIWKLVSPEARLVYLALCSKYRLDLDNNGRLHLSSRMGAAELGFGKNVIARCLRELAYYGLIVQTNAGRWHGVGIKGIAPHWRLTELACRGEPPTYDFEHFDGEVFHEQKSPAYYKRLQRYWTKLEALKARQKINLSVPASGTPCTGKRDTSVPQCRDTHPRNPRKRVSRLPVHNLEGVPVSTASPPGDEGRTVPVDTPPAADDDLRGMPKDMSRYYAQPPTVEEMMASPIDDDLDIPAFLKRGDPNCFGVKE